MLAPAVWIKVKLAQAKAEFQKLESVGIIRCSDSPWASPLPWFKNLMDPGVLAGITAV